MIDPIGVLGIVGSPIDVATFVLVVVLIYVDLRPQIDTIAAAVVALAEGERHVDHDRLQDQLDVDDSSVDALRPTIINDGGEK